MVALLWPRQSSTVRAGGALISIPNGSQKLASVLVPDVAEQFERLVAEIQRMAGIAVSAVGQRREEQRGGLMRGCHGWLVHPCCLTTAGQAQ